MKIEIIFGTFFFFQARYITMSKNEKRNCYYLIFGLQKDSTLDLTEKNRSEKSLLNRYIKLKGFRFLNEVLLNNNQQDLEDLSSSLKFYAYILGERYACRKYCKEKELSYI